MVFLNLAQDIEVSWNGRPLGCYSQTFEEGIETGIEYIELDVNKLGQMKIDDLSTLVRYVDKMTGKGLYNPNFPTLTPEKKAH